MPESWGGTQWPISPVQMMKTAIPMPVPNPSDIPVSLTNSDGVDKPSSMVEEMKERSEVCNVMFGGITCVKEEGEEYLPKNASEDSTEYATRLKRTSFFPAYKRAVEVMVGKPFSQEIVLSETTPEVITPLMDNVDLEGRDLDQFARDLFTAAINDGITWVLVDYPKVPAGLTKFEEQALGARPYFVHIPLKDVLGWSVERINGVPVLTQFRHYETTEVRVSPFSTVCVKRIRVWGPGYTAVYNPDEDGEWHFDAEASGSYSLPFIPIVPFYTNRKGFFCAHPPLEDLAWLNVTHYQSSSDQRNILHYARCPVLAADEKPKDAEGNESELSANQMFFVKNLHWVETTGAGIEAGRRDLQDLEAQMTKLAGQLLQTDLIKTATETGFEVSEGSSQLKKWVGNFEDSLELALAYMGRWLMLDFVPEVEVYKDFDDAQLTAQLVVALTNARDKGFLSQEAFTYAMDRAGFLPPGVDAKDELDKLSVLSPVAPAPSVTNITNVSPSQPAGGPDPMD